MPKPKYSAAERAALKAQGKKRCTRCAVVQPLAAFQKRRGANSHLLDSQCKECIRAARRAWYARDKTRFAEYQRRDFEKHREARLARILAWAKANPDRVRAAGKRHRQQYPERGRLRTMRRYYQQRGAFVEDVERLIVFARDDGLCGICGRPVDPADYEIDHVVPIRWGGKHCYANVQLAHRFCNRRKGARLLTHF